MELKINDMFKIKIDDEDLELVQSAYIQISYDNYLQHFPKINNDGRLSKYLMNAKRNEIVIHKNGDLMDCRKSNLYLTTQKELNKMVRNGEIEQIKTPNGAVHYKFN